MSSQPMTTDTLIALEQRRDRIADRVRRISAEPSRMDVEGFEYAQPEHAAKVRLALVKALLRNIDTINAEIGRMIEVRV
jgi:hypothetical protein